MQRVNRRDILVLWRWKEAENSQGKAMTGSVGAHMNGVRKGDRLFICATTEGELFLLGTIRVRRTGKRSNGQFFAEGTNRVTLQLLPLRKVKWQLRFESTDSDRLSKEKQIAWQVRSRRYLTPASASLLAAALKKYRALEQTARTKRKRVFDQEGRVMYRSLSVRERDRNVRRHALRIYGRECKICGLNFEKTYGHFARDCVEVHHLNPIGARTGKSRRTTSDDVIVVCPNCHRALHAFGDPSAWKQFRRDCGLE